MIVYTDQEKNQIVKQIKTKQLLSPFSNSANKFARTIGITSTDLSILYNKRWLKKEKLISDNKWLKLARIAEYNRHKKHSWSYAVTRVSSYLIDNFKLCKDDSITAIFVDDAGIGKTFTAKYFQKISTNVFYIDCSVVPRTYAFINHLARALGIDINQKQEELISEIIFVFQNLEKPLLILDEAGDLDNSTLLLIKRLYNALKGYLGMFLMGADGFKKKIEMGLKYKKLGYAEFFSRFGGSCKKVLPSLMQDKVRVFETMAEQIALANDIPISQISMVKSSLIQGNKLHDMRKVETVIKAIKK